MVLRALSYPDLDVKRPTGWSARSKKGSKRLLSPCTGCGTIKCMWTGGRFWPASTRRSRTTVRIPCCFFHGGGWVTESVDTYNAVCHQLAEHMRCKVISVEYRLAPEHRFPDGLEDCYAVAKTLLQDYDAWRVFFPRQDHAYWRQRGRQSRRRRIAARARPGEFSVARQILVYPSTYNDHSENSPFDSVRENGTDYLLTSKKIQDYMALYMRSEADLRAPISRRCSRRTCAASRER